MTLTALLAAAVTVYPAGAPFYCTPRTVWDGDGLRCAEAVTVRLSGIAAREVRVIDGRAIDAGCSPKHPCPVTSGVDARNHLARLVGGSFGVGPHGHLLVRGPRMVCRSAGPAGGKRTGAWCVAPKVGDLSCRMVQDGYALRWPRYWRDHFC